MRVRADEPAFLIDAVGRRRAQAYPRRIRFAINPPWRDLPRVNALLNGVVRSSYVVEEYETTLSIKSVAAGEAWYSTPQGRYRVTPEAFLVIDEGQRYAMDAAAGTETVCPFFAPGFVREAGRVLESTDQRLLDDPHRAGADVSFVEQLHPMNSPTGVILQSLQKAVRKRVVSQDALEDAFHQLALSLASLRREDRRKAAALPTARPATREELYRRLCRSRDYLASCYAEPIRVADAAAVAALSPFHFHRSFRTLFGVSPMEYLRQRRLEIAHDLLRRGARVTDVLGAVGFDSPSSFSALFRRTYGVRPSEVQKKQD